jgi:hypothetical protein
MKGEGMPNLASFTLPKGAAAWPHLHRPSYTFNDAGTYEVTLAVPLKDAEPVIKKLQALAKKVTGSELPPAKNSCWKMETDQTTGEETGRVLFRAAAKNQRRNDGTIWDRKPKVVDSKLNPVIRDVTSGSEIVVAVGVWHYTKPQNGINLQLNGVQVIQLAENTDALSMFKERDGFEEDATSAVASPQPTTDAQEIGDYNF